MKITISISLNRDDMKGVGTWAKDCLSLFVGDLGVRGTQKQAAEDKLRELFGVFGPILSVRVISSKGCGFVKFKYRTAAEFAKVAMADQPVGTDT